ncbi:hypothetical protein EC968_007009 [Mortierella alpina]|nr:hypothetical protein EC968_007009 [Mortierella alpina]
MELQIWHEGRAGRAEAGEGEEEEEEEDEEDEEEEEEGKDDKDDDVEGAWWMGAEQCGKEEGEEVNGERAKARAMDAEVAERVCKYDGRVSPPAVALLLWRGGVQLPPLTPALLVRYPRRLLCVPRLFRRIRVLAVTRLVAVVPEVLLHESTAWWDLGECTIAAASLHDLDG